MQGWQRGWKGILDAAVELRHHLHAHPELSWQEEQTAATVRDHLDALGIPWEACAGTGTVGRLAVDAPGRHLAFRADLDALPMTEESGVPWRSRRPGVMHACGHDGHTAALLATAAWLRAHEAGLPGPVTLLFQPAEEGGHGAREMIAHGALEGIEAIYGWHNWPSIPWGEALCPDGVVMSANGTFHVALHGEGGHASQPELCRDPVLGAAALTVALQQIISRRTAPQQACVLSVTSIQAPSTETIIPSTVRLHGSIRAPSSQACVSLFSQIRALSEATALGHGLRAEVETRPRYGATLNHPAEARRVREVLRGLLGEGWAASRAPVPLMASEDFSYYLDHRPGAFVILGGHTGPGPPIPCHSPHYDFNDRLIPVAVRLFAELAGAPPPPVDEARP